MTKKGPIHSTNNEKQLPDVASSQILGHAKSLLTVCWDVIRLIWKWNSQNTLTDFYICLNNDRKLFWNE